MLDEAKDEAMVLIDALLAEDFLPLLVDNLGRLDESVDEQAEGVHNVLGIVENLIELKPPLGALFSPSPFSFCHTRALG